MYARGAFPGQVDGGPGDAGPGPAPPGIAPASSATSSAGTNPEAAVRAGLPLPDLASEHRAGRAASSGRQAGSGRVVGLYQLAALQAALGGPAGAAGGG